MKDDNYFLVKDHGFKVFVIIAFVAVLILAAVMF